MSISTQLNEKLAKYTSPKVNWLTKRPVLLKLMGGVVAFATFFGVTVLFLTCLSLSKTYLTFGLVATVVTVGIVCIPAIALALFWLFEKQETPKKEKVIEKYTNLILKNFSEKDFNEVKIKLLKILNSEPYTPVHFLDQMLALKSAFVEQKQREEDVCLVNDSAKLTVLIEQMEKNENAEQMNKDGMREQMLRGIYKL